MQGASPPESCWAPPGAAWLVAEPSAVCPTTAPHSTGHTTQITCDNLKYGETCSQKVTQNQISKHKQTSLVWHLEATGPGFVHTLFRKLLIYPSRPLLPHPRALFSRFLTSTWREFHTVGRATQSLPWQAATQQFDRRFHPAKATQTRQTARP